MLLQQFLTNADAFPQFIVSKIVMEGGLLKKHPCDSRLALSSHKDPKNWMKLSDAIARIATLPDNFRLGFSITKETKLFFIDLDHCVVINPVTGAREWSPLALIYLRRFQYCYIEVSQSGTGLHIMGRYRGDAPPHISKNEALGIELYTHDRFVMFGGISPQGDWNHDDTEAFLLTVNEHFSAPIRSETVDHVPSTTEQGSPKFTDEEVMIKARTYKAKNAKKIFGNKATFSELYDEDIEVLGREYPSKKGKVYNGSSVDLALANMLAFHTEGNREQILRLMRGSALVRPKWDRGTYLLDTVNKAISSRQALQSSKHGQSNKSLDESQEISSDMPQEFEGCYYVYDIDKIYSISHGRTLTEKGFNVAFNDLSKIKQPHLLFTKIAAVCGRAVDGLGFRPNLPHGELIKREDEVFINCFKPLNIKRRKGNVQPFLDLIKINFPVERDQQILLSYLAALVQNPGIKSMWCLVLQGDQGCGKSFIMDFVAHAVGEKYTHRAKGDEFESKFNLTFYRKLILLIEDPILKEGRLEDRLKQLVTQTLLSFEGKGVDSKMGDHYANLIITLNDFDSFKKQKGSRRYAVLKSAMQTEDDLQKAGLTDTYFSGLARWRTQEGYETVTDFLYTYQPIPEFDFSKDCSTAPHTSTTDEAIEECKAPAETLIQEAIESGRIGFRGGLISGTQLTNMFNEQGRRGIVLHNNQRSRILKNLGYILHTQFSSGRASRKVKPDGNKPALYAKTDHPTLKMTDKESILKYYEDAQL